MLTFIYYEKEELFNQQLKYMINDSEQISYELEPNNAIQLINEINSIDIFGTKRTFVIHGANFFQIKSHKFKKKELELLINTLQNSEDQIIIALTKALNFKNVHVNAFVDRNYIDLSDEKKVADQYINDFIQSENINIDYKNLQILKYNLDNNYLLVKNELQKLSNYTNNKAITQEIIENFGVKTIEANAFDLLGHIMNNNIKEANELYTQIIHDGNNPVSILGLLSTQIRFNYQVKLLNSTNSASEIATILKANPYRVKMTIKNINRVSIHQIAKIYLNCSKIDYLIKSGRLNQDLIFDYLIY